MTTTRFLLARFAQAFGIARRQRRLVDAAAESHLLREAEQVLGERIWQKAEHIEELGIEYWNIRRLVAEREELEKQNDEAEERLAEAHAQRADLLSIKSPGEEELDEQRLKLQGDLDELAKERDGIVNKAREVRRVYDGLKIKLDVLKTERQGETDSLKITTDRMGQLRSEFEELKRKRDELATRIETRDQDLDRIEQSLETEKKKHREEASEAFMVIGEANQKISSFRVELGIIETQLQQLFSEVGRHISRNASVNADCRTASQADKPMVNVMAALRQSINYNQQLSGR